MKRNVLIVCSSLLVTSSIVVLSLPSRAKDPQNPATNHSAEIEHGRYLVHNVAMCIDCHSPRTPEGQFIEDRHLTGSPLAFAATVPMPWAPFAPPIAGLPPHYTRESMVHFLTTGERPVGLPTVLPPMPSVRMNEADAIAVTAYLESLAANP